MLRQKGVVGKFVEYFGPGVSRLSLPDRATIANMAPEYGATIGFFPIDAETLRYLRNTGRPAEQIDLVERYARAQDLFYAADTPEPLYSDTLTLDLSAVEPCLAGPKRPQDRVPLRDVKASFRHSLPAPTAQRGYALSSEGDRGTMPPYPAPPSPTCPPVTRPSCLTAPSSSRPSPAAPTPPTRR